MRPANRMVAILVDVEFNLPMLLIIQCMNLKLLCMNSKVRMHFIPGRTKHLTLDLTAAVSHLSTLNAPVVLEPRAPPVPRPIFLPPRFPTGRSIMLFSRVYAPVYIMANGMYFGSNLVAQDQWFPLLSGMIYDVLSNTSQVLFTNPSRVLNQPTPSTCTRKRRGMFVISVTQEMQWDMAQMRTQFSSLLPSFFYHLKPKLLNICLRNCRI